MLTIHAHHVILLQMMTMMTLTLMTITLTALRHQHQLANDRRTVKTCKTSIAEDTMLQGQGVSLKNNASSLDLLLLVAV